MGELLALTPADFDFENCKLRINKSFQKLQGRNVITSPKTPKSNRVIYMPEFLAEEVKDYQCVITSTSKSEQKNVIFAYLIHTFLCKKRLRSIFNHIDSGEQNIIYSSSSFLPDVLPAVYMSDA